MPLHGIKLVTFDATNTLLKFRAPPWDYYATVAKKYGFKGNGISIKSSILDSYKYMSKEYPNFGKNTISWEQWWSRIIEKTFRDELDSDNINKVSKKLIEDYKTTICWLKAEGADDLVSYLKKSGITIGVISNFDPRLKDVLYNLGMSSWFEFVLTSYEVGISKPDKKIFELAEARCKEKVKSSQCLHIGDDINTDFNGAQSAGWHAWLLIDEANADSQTPKERYSSLTSVHKNIEKKYPKYILSQAFFRKGHTFKPPPPFKIVFTSPIY